MCEYALNQKDKSVTPNDIMRFPSAQPGKRTEERTETHGVCLDVIDRQAAQTELMIKCERYTLARESHGMGHVEWSSDLISVADAMDAIRDLPSAQPERKKGRWIVYYECPKCGEITKDFTEYCPFCNADMRGEEDE